MYKTEITWKYKYLVRICMYTCVIVLHCICGYHLCHIWTTVVESLACERKPFNSSDAYAAAVLKDDVIGHISRHLSHCLHLEYYWLHCHCVMEEDIPQVCHSEDSNKILTNYLSVTSMRNE